MYLIYLQSAVIVQNVEVIILEKMVTEEENKIINARIVVVNIFLNVKIYTCNPGDARPTGVFPALRAHHQRTLDNTVML